MDSIENGGGEEEEMKEAATPEEALAVQSDDRQYYEGSRAEFRAAESDLFAVKEALPQDDEQRHADGDIPLSDDWLRHADGPPPSYRSMDDNRTETTNADDSEDWDCCPPMQLPPLEAEDLARATRLGPDRLTATSADRPRRLAVCHSVGGRYDGLQLMGQPQLARQNSGDPPFTSVLLVKYYDTHDRLGVYDGHEGTYLGDLSLQLEEGSQFADLCFSNRHRMIYLADQSNSRVYAVDLAGKLHSTVSKRLSGPQAVSFDDRLSLLIVCQRKKVLVFQQRSRQLRYVRSLKSPQFRNLTSAAARDGRLWLADSQADRLFVYGVTDAEITALSILNLQNPLCISLDASGCALVVSGEPLHRVSVFGPGGTEVGSFGSWGTKSNRMKMPIAVCAYQLSHLVDKRMLVVGCFAEHTLRMYPLRNPDTSVI